MKRVLAGFQQYLKANLADNTVQSYLSDINRFIRLKKIKTVKQLSSVTGAEISDYIESMKNQGASYSTICRSVASLKKFFRYCTEEGITDTKNIVNLDVPKQKRKLPNSLSTQEVDKLLEAPDISTIKGIRDKAMLEVMYATGCRVSELISLKLHDVSISNAVVMLGPNKKKRFVPMGRASVESVINYIRNSRPNIPFSNKSDALFLNFYGEPLTRQGFWKVVKRYIEKCDISGNVTAQTLRHCFALHLLSNGADVESVSEMLGHSDVATTKVYFDVLNDKIKQVYNKAHPRA